MSIEVFAGAPGDPNVQLALRATGVQRGLQALEPEGLEPEFQMCPSLCCVTWGAFLKLLPSCSYLVRWKWCTFIGGSFQRENLSDVASTAPTM